MLHPNLAVNHLGHLTVGGVDTVMLAEKYGTPLYILDEDLVRSKCRTYVNSMKEHFGGTAAPLYASKALSFKGIYTIAAEEGMCIDVVSAGELYTALQAGFPAEKIFFHGSNKTAAEIRYAIENGLGCFIVDNDRELDDIDAIAAELGKRQDILVRITPGIDPHTFEAINTGKIDCQFGIPLATGQALPFMGEVLKKEHVNLRGVHCHIGSQIFDEVPFCDAADVILDFISELRSTYGYTAEILNLGGGFGVRYVESDPGIDIASCIEKIAAHVKAKTAEHNLPELTILMEPGRSLVADAGVTIYSVGSIKTIDGYRTYVSVDGGMTDNPRYALYGADYTVLLANKADAPADFLCTVAGRCCESGALIQENILLPRPVPGDHIAVLVTGAYNHSMASNYNRVCRPPIVMVSGGQDRLAVRRETFEDLIARDL